MAGNHSCFSSLLDDAEKEFVEDAPSGIHTAGLPQIGPRRKIKTIRFCIELANNFFVQVGLKSPNIGGCPYYEGKPAGATPLLPWATRLPSQRKSLPVMRQA